MMRKGAGKLEGRLNEYCEMMQIDGVVGNMEILYWRELRLLIPYQGHRSWKLSQALLHTKIIEVSVGAHSLIDMDMVTKQILVELHEDIDHISCSLPWQWPIMGVLNTIASFTSYSLFSITLGLLRW